MKPNSPKPKYKAIEKSFEEISNLKNKNSNFKNNSSKINYLNRNSSKLKRDSLDFVSKEKYSLSKTRRFGPLNPLNNFPGPATYFGNIQPDQHPSPMISFGYKLDEPLESNSQLGPGSYDINQNEKSRACTFGYMPRNQKEDFPVIGKTCSHFCSLKTEKSNSKNKSTGGTMAKSSRDSKNLDAEGTPGPGEYLKNRPLNIPFGGWAANSFSFRKRLIKEKKEFTDTPGPATYDLLLSNLFKKNKKNKLIKSKVENLKSENLIKKKENSVKYLETRCNPWLSAYNTQKTVSFGKAKRVFDSIKKIQCFGDYEVMQINQKNIRSFSFSKEKTNIRERIWKNVYENNMTNNLEINYQNIERNTKLGFFTIKKRFSEK